MIVGYTLSQSYHQLASIFEALEKANFEPHGDFGANVTECFCWYLSPKAVDFLNKRYHVDWFAIQGNPKFKITFQRWQGITGNGAYIALNL